MSGETFKILAGMLALERFTGAELAEATEVNPHTVNSWLQRSNRAGKYITEVDRETSGRGRPRIIWGLIEGDIETIRAELSSLSNLGRSDDDATSAEDAREAFEDDDIRNDILFQLSRAELAESDAARAEAIAKAQEWYEFELERLKLWADSGYAPPEQIATEIAKLDRRIKGLRIYVEKLGGMAMQGVDGFADWFERAIGTWFDGETPQPGGFHPLVPALQEGSEHRDSLKDTLRIILETAEEVSIIPQDYLICGLVMAMARIRDANAYLAIADILQETGYDTVGDALTTRLDAAHDNEQTMRFIHQTLIGLADLPAMLQNPKVGGWADRLISHRLYRPLLALGLLHCLERRAHADQLRIAREKADELAFLRNEVDQNSSEWQQMNKGLEHKTPDFLDWIDRLTEVPGPAQNARLNPRQSTDQDAQTDKSGMVDLFQALFDPGSRADAAT